MVSRSAITPRSPRVCGRRSRPRSARFWRVSASAISGGATVSTNCSSNCRWPAGTSRAARSPSPRLGAVLVDHLPADDPFVAYARRLDELDAGSIRGYLNGSIDAVVRVPQSSGAARFALLDYKTNWLAPPGDVLTAWHYRPSALALEMQRAHYGLQAILYTVALHRYLRWRVPGYDPEVNLGGAFYLFLRGMVGAETPLVDGAPCGVFGWRPSATVVEALSDVLDGRSVEMTTFETELDPFDIRRARRASGLLREFNDVGVLTAADVHVALRLRELAGVDDEWVLLAAALAVRAPRLANVTVDLATIHETATVESDEDVDLSTLPWPPVAEWIVRVGASELVAVGDTDADGSSPFRLVGSKLYLDRYWREERGLASDLLALSGAFGLVGGPRSPSRGPRATLPRRDCRPSVPRSRLGCVATTHRRRGRTGNRQDDDRRPDRGPARRAGGRELGSAASRRTRRPDRKGRIASRRGGARRGAEPAGRRRGSSPTARVAGIDDPPTSRLAPGQSQPFSP